MEKRKGDAVPGQLPPSSAKRRRVGAMRPQVQPRARGTRRPRSRVSAAGSSSTAPAANGPSVPSEAVALLRLNRSADGSAATAEATGREQPQGSQSSANGVPVGLSRPRVRSRSDLANSDVQGIISSSSSASLSAANAVRNANASVVRNSTQVDNDEDKNEIVIGPPEDIQTAASIENGEVYIESVQQSSQPSDVLAEISRQRNKAKKRKSKAVSSITEELRQLPMKAFIKDRKNGIVAPSALERKKRMAKKRAEDKRLRKLGKDPAEERRKARERAEKAAADAEAAAEHVRTPQVTIKDGKIIVDTGNMVIREKPDSSIDQPVHEDEGARMTSASFSKRRGALKWTEEETKLFYRALRQCGQDFSLIAEFFPNRTRRQIKLKYKREEREHPNLVEKSLNRKTSLPLEMQNMNSELVQEYESIENTLKEKGIQPASTLEEAIEAVKNFSSTFGSDEDEEEEDDDDDDDDDDELESEDGEINGTGHSEPPLQSQAVLVQKS